MQAKKGQWVQIHNVVLKVGERAAAAPEDTQAVPLEMWVKGYLTADAELGAECEIMTPTSRLVSGRLEEIEPGYNHGFGEYIPELDTVRRQVREMVSLEGGVGA